MPPTVDPAAAHEAAKWKHERGLSACRFHPGGAFAFTGGENNDVTRWDLATGAMLPFQAHDSWVRAIGFSPDGQTLYTGGYDGRLIWWPLAELTAPDAKPVPSRKLDPAHNGWLRALAVSPDGKTIATCGNDNLVKLWDAAEGKLLHDLAGHPAHVYNVAFHPGGEFLVSCDLKGGVRQWSVADGKQTREIAAAALHKYDTTFRADIGGARSIAFSGDGKLLAVGGITNVTNAFAGIGNAAVLTLNWDTGELVKTHLAKAPVNGVAWGVRWHPAGYWVALSGGGGGGFLYFFKPDAVNEFALLKLPDSGRDLDLSPDGLRASVAHADGHLRLYALHKKA